MAKTTVGASWILVSMFIIVLATHVTSQTILNFFDSISKQTQEVFNKIAEPVGNYTKEFIGNMPHNNISNKAKKVLNSSNSNL